MRRIAVLPTLLVLLAIIPASASGGNYITRDQLDLTTILAPPPGRHSATTKAEIQQLLVIQQNRTPEQVAAAQADVAQSVFRFANVLGPGFTAERLPIARDFFARIADDGLLIVDPAKDLWKRKRPRKVDPRIEPAVSNSRGGSYPSSHAAFAYLTAIVLADMVPEKRAALLARAADFSHNRLVGGMHYPSDIEAGRIAGTAIAAQEEQNPRFKADFEQAKEEVRQQLGLGN